MTIRKSNSLGILCLVLFGSAAIVGFFVLRIDNRANAQLPATALSSDETAAKEATGKKKVDDSQVVVNYANFVRVTGTAEEIVLDFGFITDPVGASDRVTKISQREALNMYCAKRLSNALQLTIQRYESKFGPIETDIDKRMQDAQKK